MTERRAATIAARVLALAGPLACAAYAIAHRGSVLYGGFAWLVFLAAALAGAGHLVERLVRVRVDLGLRFAWGAAAFLAVAGVFLAAGLLTAQLLLGLLALGYAGFAWREWTIETPSLLATGRTLRRLAADPLPFAFFALIALLALVNLAAGLAEMQGNTYDDDVVYTPLIKRLLDVGDINEPFSFRRISAMGGQTVLGALAAVRGTLGNLYLVDGALFQAIALLMVIGMMRQRRGGTDPLLAALVLLVFVLLPNTAINTGTHWTGVVMFLGLYRTFTLAERADAPLPRVFAAAGVLAAAACTLRQNFLPVGLLFPLVVLLIRLGRTPRATFRAERKLWLATLCAGALVLVPYCIASWRSNGTFLYPLWLGTFNPDVPTQATLYSGWQEAQFFIRVLLEPDPVRVIVFLLPVFFLARDTRPGRPLSALLVASSIGFVFVVHSFTLSDQFNLWRYAFGYMFPLFLALVIDGGGGGLRRTDDDDGPVRVPLLGRVVIVVCLIGQLVLAARGIARKYPHLAADLERAAATHRNPHRPLELERTYAALQAATPVGATIAVALDEPSYLDFARNRIINIDTPGFASFAPGVPSFQGPEPVAAYYLAHGIRHVAFVRGEHSRYQFRRDFWIRRIINDGELWRVQGAYTVDAIDNFAALATTRQVLFEGNGVVLLDLAVKR